MRVQNRHCDTAHKRTTQTPCIFEKKAFTFQTVEIIYNLKHSLFYLTSAASLCQCVLKYHSKFSMKLFFSKSSSLSFHLPLKILAGNNSKVPLHSNMGGLILLLLLLHHIISSLFLFYKRQETTVGLYNFTLLSSRTVLRGRNCNWNSKRSGSLEKADLFFLKTVHTFRMTEQ